MNNKVVWVLEYNFHLYTINLEEKEVTPTKEYFDTIEDLLKTYREKMLYFVNVLITILIFTYIEGY